MRPGNANSKIVRVNNEMGAKNINKQQGTTRTVYDSLEYKNTGAKQTFRFFENVNTRQFPFTNITENKLQIGESIAIQRFSFQLLIMSVPEPGRVLQITPLDNIAFGSNGLYRSDMSLQIAQDTVIKKQPLHSMYAPFNKDARFYGSVLVNIGTPTEDNIGLPQDVFHLDNPIILPPQIEFTVILESSFVTLNISPADSKPYLMCTLEGLGSLYAPKSTY